MEKKKYPFGDEIMKYDYIHHRYVLTKQGVLSELGEDLDIILNTTLVSDVSIMSQRVLDKVSQVVYFYLYQDTMNRDWLEYILATYPPLREWVQEMLQAQLEYVLENNFVNDFSGVNIAKGQTIDVNWLRNRVKIADQVEQLAYQFVPGLGYCLKYCGQLPRVPCHLYHRGY